MAKNILIFNGSPRKDGNTETLVDTFIKGASSAGHNVKKINLSFLDIRPCYDCKYCFENKGKCVQVDDMIDIYAHLQKNDVIIFASPLYFYGFSAQMKVMIDRLYAIIRGTNSITEAGLILVGGDSNKEMFEPTITQYKAFTEFLNWKDIGHVICPGISERGEINNTPFIEEAYNFIKNI